MVCFFATDEAIERVALGLLDRSLPKSEWTHAGHFAAALWMIRHREATVALMPTIIRRYNEATGVANTLTSGYHHTITCASLRAAAAVLAEQPASVSLSRIANDLMASPLGHPGWLLDYWSPSRLNSAAARADWVEPDRAPLPYPALDCVG